MDCVISRQTMMQYDPPAELGSITPLPHGFLADLAAAQDTDALQSILAPLGNMRQDPCWRKECMQHMSGGETTPEVTDGCVLFAEGSQQLYLPL
jgi:hypothetical protein